MNHGRVSTFAFWGLVASGLVVVCGCGKAEYERRVFANSGGPNAEILGPAVQIPGTQIMVQLPRTINENAKAYVEGAQEPNGVDIVKPERLNPPFMKIPGLRICYEVQIEDQLSRTKLPIYWYLGVLTSQDPPLPDGKTIDQYAVDAIAAAGKGQATTEPLAVGNTTWSKLTFTGQQVFIDLEGKSFDTEGTFQMLSTDLNGTRVVIAYRVPGLFFKLSKAADVLPLVAGSVKPAPVTVAPDQAPGEAQ